MQQIQTYLTGERNYLKIRGSTGPLVYPAAHVYIYKLLHSATSSGTDIPTAQLVFGVLYLATLALVMLCYRQARVPPYVYALLVLSKRLHSVYVLRLFNDCWAVLFLWLAVYLLQKRQWKGAALVFSIGLGVKMSLLLVLPAVAVVLFLAQGPWGALSTAAAMLQYQVLIGWPFLSTYPREYLGRAFEFGREFDFKWTVNWRFVGKEVFGTREFATGLLIVHGSLLVAFAVKRWLWPARMGLGGLVASVFQPLPAKRQEEIAARVTPEFVLSTVLTANVIGMLSARTLHYQFYSWLAWGTPYLLWRAGWHPAVQVGAWLLQEVAWNVYPSTWWSSLLAVVLLAMQVGGMWSVGAPQDKRVRSQNRPKSPPGQKKGQAKQRRS